MEKKKAVERISNLYTILGVLFVTVAMVFIFIPTIPYIWYTFYPEATEQEVENISAEIFESAISIEEETEEKEESNLPPQDKNLPTDNFLVIDSIGVNSPIGTDPDYATVLKEGAWLAADYGTPSDNTFSIIIAAHRFGYAFWDTETRSEVSFFNLPKVEKGDEIKIIWDQRAFTYEVYAEEESTYITDYNADLILYTCKYFNSPVRIFKYARATY